MVRRTVGTATLIILLLLCLSIITVRLWPRPIQPAADKSDAGLALISAPSGSDLLLEVFPPGADQPLWRLHLAKIVMTDTKTIEAEGVQAEYRPQREPAVLSCARLISKIEPNRLIFRGDVHMHMQNTGFVLDCAELVWDEHSHSFAIDGGYVLKRAGQTMRGRRLWLSEDLATVQTTGPVQISGGIEGKAE